jgi:hypothetical protein
MEKDKLYSIKGSAVYLGTSACTLLRHGSRKEAFADEGGFANDDPRV